MLIGNKLMLNKCNLIERVSPLTVSFTTVYLAFIYEHIKTVVLM